MNTKISKTLITRTEDLKPGDVIYTYEKGQELKKPDWPKCNFHRVSVVTNVFQLEDGEWRFDFHRQDWKFTSDNGDHKVVEEALKNNIVLEGGTFGCNQTVEGGHPNFRKEVYRLDNVKEVKYPNYSLPNLKGNPAYDLMM